MKSNIYKITPEVSPSFYIRAKTYEDAGFLALACLIGYDQFFPPEAKDRHLDARCITGSQFAAGWWQAFDFTGCDKYFGEKILVERPRVIPATGVFVTVRPRVY